MLIIFVFANVDEIKNHKYRNDNNVYLGAIIGFSIIGMLMQDVYGFVYLALTIISIVLFMGNKYINVPSLENLKTTKFFRKFGIGIALGTCVKLIIIDTYGMGYMQKAIAFIIVGVLALVISYIYSLIDKKIS